MVANQAEPGDEWDYDIKPTYVIAIARHRMFDDDRIVHRATVTDLETYEKFMECYLNRLKELPPAINERKFRQLTESSKVSKFSKEEFEAYQKVFHEKWDHNVLRRSFFEEFADDVNAKVEGRAREIAKRMLAGGKLTDEEIAAYSGLSVEDVIVLRSQADT